MDTIRYTVHRNCAESNARLGELVTSHGTIATPVFMPVGSQATVKTLTPEDLYDIDFNIILSNSYHLYLRPGIYIIREAGGLHRFMNWERAILTDSGGFQIFSLSRLRKVNDDGVVFRSHIDGSEHFITPERAVEIQEALGSDIAMVLDEVPAPDDSDRKIIQAMHRTHCWAERCLNARKRSGQALFAIVQGGLSPELRKESAGCLTGYDFDGYAIGGLSLGETKEQTYSMVNTVCALLPENKPRYLMGVGSPEDLVTNVDAGVDMFDCVLPTRIARNGALLTWNGRINIRNSQYKTQMTPVDERCTCYTCRNFSAAYLHHLFRCEELLAYRLATVHNLTFMYSLMKEIRESIVDGTFPAFKEKFLQRYSVTDETVRVEQKKKWLKTQERKDIE